MGIRKALLFSFAGHLFFFSFFGLTFENHAVDSREKITVAFLGSILTGEELYHRYTGRPLRNYPLNYAPASFIRKDVLSKNDKPAAGLGNIAPPKVLNKFLVFKQKAVASEKQKAQERYLTSQPAWERVDLKLKVE
jgi:hypothetical protein